MREMQSGSEVGKQADSAWKKEKGGGGVEGADCEKRSG